jgi:hypothetical protein
MDYKISKKINRTLTAANVQFAALFGSRAKGTAKTNSDYDFLIKFAPSHRYSIFDLLDLRQNLRRDLKKPVDVITFEGLNPKMKFEVFKTMKVIYEK